MGGGRGDKKVVLYASWGSLFSTFLSFRESKKRQRAMRPTSGVVWKWSLLLFWYSRTVDDIYTLFDGKCWRLWRDTILSDSEEVMKDCQAKCWPWHLSQPRSTLFLRSRSLLAPAKTWRIHSWYFTSDVEAEGLPVAVDLCNAHSRLFLLKNLTTH